MEGMEGMDRVSFFDELAPRWDEISRSGTPRMVEVLDRVELHPDSRVLDLGCGTGRTVRYLLSRLGTAGRVTAVDFSPGMLQILRATIDDTRLECLQAEIGSLDRSVTGFDVVLLFDILPHLPRADRVLADLAGRLVPGGRLVLAHDVGREELDQVHGRHGGRIGSDRLPPNARLVSVFQAAGMQVQDLCDQPDSYLLVGRVASNPTP